MSGGIAPTVGLPPHSFDDAQSMGRTLENLRPPAQQQLILHLQRTQGNAFVRRLVDPVQRSSATDLDNEYKTAVDMGDWQAAAEWLNGFNKTDILDRLGQLTQRQRQSLYEGALANPRVGANAQVAQLVGPQMSGGPSSPVPAPGPGSPGGATKSVAEMSSTEKLEAALHKAPIGDAVRQQIESLVSAKTLVIALLSFVTFFVIAQLTPAGWAADLGLAITGVFVGSVLFDAINHLVGFAKAVDAANDDQLQVAGNHFAEAVAEIGVNALIMLVLHSSKGPPSGSVPIEGPTPTAFADVLTNEGVLIRVPVEVAPAPATVLTPAQAAQIGATAAAASHAMMSMSGSGGGGDSSSGSGGGSSTSAGPTSSARREFFDLDEAASAALGEPAEVTGSIGDIGPIKNADVRADLERLGYNPDEFRAVQYQARGAKGQFIITIFQADGGVYYGPHLSSANW
jgi:hypothetical protein